LHRAVVELDEPNTFVKQLGESVSDLDRFRMISRRERIVVKSHAVNDRHQKQRPVGAPLGHCRRFAIINRQEDVSDLLEVGERILIMD
jgi:hypothetical protein